MKGDNAYLKLLQIFHLRSNKLIMLMLIHGHHRAACAIASRVVTKAPTSDCTCNRSEDA